MLDSEDIRNFLLAPVILLLRTWVNPPKCHAVEVLMVLWFLFNIIFCSKQLLLSKPRAAINITLGLYQPVLHS